MKRPVKLGIASLRALALVVALGAIARAGLPYLPLIGPPPLRLQPAQTSAAKFKLETAPIKPVVPTSNVPATNPPVAATKADAGSITNSAGDRTLASEPETNAVESVARAFNPPVFALPTPELVSITPQMLATYFRPMQFGSNATVVLPLPLSFQPPQPSSQKSSHAEYILK